MPSTGPSTQETSTREIVGAPMDRVDGPVKVSGRAPYAADFRPPNLAYAYAVRSTIASGRVKSIDRSAAEAQPGVLAIISHDNAPPLYRVSMQHAPGKPGQTYLPLQDDRVKYAGQYLAVVVADTFTHGRDAAMALHVEYENEPGIVQWQEAVKNPYKPQQMAFGNDPDYSRGDPDHALAAAEVKIDQQYTTPVENHNPIEMSATTALWEGDKLTLYTATQFVNGSRSVVSTWLGIDAENVQVIDPYVGGGFGCKGSCWPHEVLAAIAARQVGRPVQLMFSRAEMFTGVGHRPVTQQHIVLAADRQGNLKAIIHECTSSTSAWKDPWVELASQQSRMLYACENVRTTQRLATLNCNTPTQMRAPGHATGTFALESAMDELAIACNIDPVELRLRNHADQDPEESLPFSSKELKKCYQQAAERFGWEKRNPKVGSMRDGDVLVGYGMATATYPTRQSTCSAEIEVKPDGSAQVTLAAHDLGTGAYTVLTQIASSVIGIPPQRITTRLAATQYPSAPVAGGSQTTASAGSAVKVVGVKVAAAIKERSAADPHSPLFNKDPKKEIVVADGRVFLKEEPATGETIAALLQRNGNRSVSARGSVEPPPGGQATEPAGSSHPGQKPQYSRHAFGADFVEVRIDPLTRQIRVPRITAAFAAGTIINRKTAHSQIMGGIVWGVSMALFEQTIHDPRRGSVVNDNLADYLVPTNPDIDQIDCFFVEEKDEVVNPVGAKGIGEIGITGVAAAIANAVYHATGKRIRDLPITLDKLL